MAKRLSKANRKTGGGGKKSAPNIAQSPAIATASAEKPDDLMSRVSSGLIRYERKKRRRRFAKRMVQLLAVLCCIAAAAVWAPIFSIQRSLLRYMPHGKWLNVPASEKSDQPTETSSSAPQSPDQPT